MIQPQSRKKGYQQYAKNTVRTQASGANPVQLIGLLYKEALNSIRLTKLHIQKGEMAEKNKHLSRALNIINEGLIPALNYDAGGELATNMRRSYDYVCDQLMYANADNDIEKLSHAERVLSEISAGWDEMSQMRGEAQAHG